MSNQWKVLGSNLSPPHFLFYSFFINLVSLSNCQLCLDYMLGNDLFVFSVVLLSVLVSHFTVIEKNVWIAIPSRSFFLPDPDISPPFLLLSVIYSLTARSISLMEHRVHTPERTWEPSRHCACSGGGGQWSTSCSAASGRVCPPSSSPSFSWLPKCRSSTSTCSSPPALTQRYSQQRCRSTNKGTCKQIKVHHYMSRDKGTHQ